MATSGLSRVIRSVAVMAALAPLAACGGREDLAPVEYLFDGGAVASPSTGVVTSDDMPPVESAPLAPVDRGGIEARPLDEPVAVEAAPAVAASVAGGESVGAGETVVAPGETLSAVARRTGVPMRDLIVENGLAAPFTLQPGQRLRLPEARYHTVAAGDTVYNISRRYGVDQASLMRENGIEPPFTIKLGQRLRIPGQVQTPAVAETASPVVAAPAVSVPAGAPEILPQPSATVAEPEPAPITIVEPDPDTLPPPADGSAFVPPVAAATRANVPQPGRKPAPPRETAAAPRPAATATAPSRTVAEVPDSRLRFTWPVAGDVISPFGPKAGGQHNDGINIQAAQGTTVRAAEGGTVAYAGNEIRGFGNLVLIRHNGTYMTAYAHNATLLVKQGDKVGRGQPIARVGNSGQVTVPQLHFEVRKNGTPVDPLKYLDGGAG